MKLHGCPRCNGAVLEYPAPAVESAYCVNCGWRRPDIPLDIQALVEEHLGKPLIEGRYTHQQIGTGRPAPNGWDRIKRHREREMEQVAGRK